MTKKTMDIHFSPISNRNPNSCTSSSSSSLHRRRNKKGKTGDTKRDSPPATKLSTDPQSVAARERRHRISDRFKILQSMVPGGSKMDTVSLLDEAIEYVKFLKAQIWLHQNLMLFFDHATPFCSAAGDVTGVDNGPCTTTSTGSVSSASDAYNYAPMSETYLQTLPPEYNSWFSPVV